MSPNGTDPKVDMQLLTLEMSPGVYPSLSYTSVMMVIRHVAVIALWRLPNLQGYEGKCDTNKIDQQMQGPTNSSLHCRRYSKTLVLAPLVGSSIEPVTLAASTCTIQC